MQTLRLAGQFVLDGGLALRGSGGSPCGSAMMSILRACSGRTLLALHEGLLRAHQASHAEASTQEGLAVIQQLPGNLHQGVIDVQSRSVALLARSLSWMAGVSRRW